MTTLEYPDGTTVRASSLARREANASWRDFGLYLDPGWLPSWPAKLIEWADFGVPASDERAFHAICDAFERARSGQRVEIGCLGGLGRTGTVLACFAVMCGCSAENAIGWVRSHYDGRAIETPAQAAWVGWFAGRLSAGDGVGQ